MMQKNKPHVSGIILIDKDKGIYSNTVVEEIRKIIKGVKVGHLGTLDPLCTGILPICIGKATRLSSILMKSNKKYRAVFLLGIETDTFDVEGKTIQEKDARHITLSLIENTLQSFTGTIKQIPPFYSAKKYKGKPLYKYARSGILIALEPADVRIDDLTVISYHDNELEIELTCSSGTYVRSLAHDIGNKLGCGACCKSIRRIAWSSYKESDAITLAQFRNSTQHNEFIIPLNQLLTPLFSDIVLEERYVQFFIKGLDIPAGSLSQILPVSQDSEASQEFFRAFNVQGEFIGILKKINDYFHPFIVL